MLQIQKLKPFIYLQVCVWNNYNRLRHCCVWHDRKEEGTSGHRLGSFAAIAILWRWSQCIHFVAALQCQNRPLEYTQTTKNISCLRLNAIFVMSTRLRQPWTATWILDTGNNKDTEAPFTQRHTRAKSSCVKCYASSRTLPCYLKSQTWGASIHPRIIWGEQKKSVAEKGLNLSVKDATELWHVFTESSIFIQMYCAMFASSVLHPVYKGRKFIVSHDRVFIEKKISLI